MADQFDTADFDTSPPAADPGADYRTLLDAMRQAGAEGVAQQATELAHRIEQDARQRAEWGQQMGAAVSNLQRSAGQLQQVSTGIWLDRIKEWVFAALIGLGLIFVAAVAYRWAQTPQVETRLYGCNARWVAKTGCKGQWVPLQQQRP